MTNLSICSQHPLVWSMLFSYGMQPINFLLSYNSICDNFTGLVEFAPAAALGYFCWIQNELGGRNESNETNYIFIQTITSFALILWSLRLGIFLLYRMRIRPAVDTRLGEANLRNKKSMLKTY